jgi:hypothetical protein
MYSRVVARHAIHLSDTQAASDFASGLDQLSAEAQVCSRAVWGRFLDDRYGFPQRLICGWL